jgi:flagellar biosynthetic protein FlhB
MSAPGGEDGGEKIHEPTPRKLEEARRQGDIPRSTDLNFTAALFGLALACATAGGFTVGHAGAALAGWVEQMGAATAPLDIGTIRADFGGLMATLLFALIPVFGLPALLVLVSITAQRGFVFAPQKAAPKLSRINPVDVAKQKFGRTGLFEFAKSALKLFVISLAIGIFLYANRAPLIGSLQATPGQVGVLMGKLLLDFLWVSLAISGAIAALDYLFQVADHRMRQSMTHKEMRDEMKQTEGDPYVKQARRQRGHEIATNRMLADVPRADVVVVNPTHYAVALKWDRAAGRAPHCVAKGEDAIAARIREVAQQAGVPIHRDPPAARALHAALGLGEEIRPEHYRAVAAAIRFAEDMRRRARARGR